jgi:hypothetical protein
MRARGGGAQGPSSQVAAAEATRARQRVRVAAICGGQTSVKRAAGLSPHLADPREHALHLGGPLQLLRAAQRGVLDLGGGWELGGWRVAFLIGARRETTGGGGGGGTRAARHRGAGVVRCVSGARTSCSRWRRHVSPAKSLAFLPHCTRRPSASCGRSGGEVGQAVGGSTPGQGCGKAARQRVIRRPFAPPRTPPHLAAGLVGLPHAGLQPLPPRRHAPVRRGGALQQGGRAGGRRAADPSLEGRRRLAPGGGVASAGGGGGGGRRSSPTFACVGLSPKSSPARGDPALSKQPPCPVPTPRPHL